MLQLVEMEGKMTENGCIEIPAVVLEQAGICTGDTVKLVYMAEDGELKNTAKEFLLARAGQDVAEELAKEENIAFQIPEELLRDSFPSGSRTIIVSPWFSLFILQLFYSSCRG